MDCWGYGGVGVLVSGIVCRVGCCDHVLMARGIVYHVRHPNDKERACCGKTERPMRSGLRSRDLYCRFVDSGFVSMAVEDIRALHFLPGCLWDLTSDVSFFRQPMEKLFINPGAASSMLFRVSCAAKPETVEKVCEIVRKQLALPDESNVTGESKFFSLGADSLDTVEIVMGPEEAFGIIVEEDSAQAIATVQDAADLIDDHVTVKSA